MAKIAALMTGGGGSTPSMKADLTKEMALLTASNPTYTTTKPGILIGSWSSGGATMWIKINDVTVYTNTDSRYSRMIGDGEYGMAVPSGATVEIRNVTSINPQVHIYEMQ